MVSALFSAYLALELFLEESPAGTFPLADLGRSEAGEENGWLGPEASCSLSAFNSDLASSCMDSVPGQRLDSG